MSLDKDKKQGEYKIVLIGETAVGKTSLLERYLYATFSKNSVITVSATYATKKVKKNDGKEIILQLWDTAGQENYKSLAKLFYKNAAVIIMVYDITNRKSFDEIKNYWYKQVKENASPKVKIAIVGNKFDLYINEEVKKEEGRTYAEKIGAMFRFTSALDATGVDDLFIDIANALDSSDYCIGKNVGGVKLNKNNNNNKNKNNNNERCC